MISTLLAFCIIIMVNTKLSHFILIPSFFATLYFTFCLGLDLQFNISFYTSCFSFCIGVGIEWYWFIIVASTEIQDDRECKRVNN